jgi:purine nucleosidase
VSAGDAGSQTRTTELAGADEALSSRLGYPQPLAGESDIYYIDCDPGIDDALALAYLLRIGVDIASIGVVAGNVEVSDAAENARRLLALAGRLDIPISIGRNDPIVGKYWGGAPTLHGADGLGGVQLPPSDAAFDPLPAPARIVDLANRYQTRLRIIALGPLTNLAAAMEYEPAIPKMVGAVTVMGGAFRVPGNVTLHAEANIYADPDAADRVLGAPWRDLLLVPLDITNQHRLSATEIDRLAEPADPLSQRLSEMLVFYLKGYHAAYGHSYCLLHDPLAAALAIGSIELAQAQDCRIAVITDDAPDRGKTVISVLADTDTRQPRTRVALSTEQFLTPMLLEALGAP